MALPPPSLAFDAVLDADTKLVVLGSLPGQASLRARRYYAHPQNQFWRLMSGVIGTDLVVVDYPERLAALLGAGVGLWDVIASANRVGSLDAAIREAEMRDLRAMLAAFPSIRALAFNGGTALRIGSKQLGDPLPCPMVALPSSSAAYTIGIEAKQAAWNAIRRYL